LNFNPLFFPARAQADRGCSRKMVSNSQLILRMLQKEFARFLQFRPSTSICSHEFSQSIGLSLEDKSYAWFFASFTSVASVLSLTPFSLTQTGKSKKKLC